MGTKMLKHAESELRRTIIANMVVRLRDADLMRAYRYSPHTKDPIVAYQLFRDQIHFLLDGLERALAGDSDPFQLALRGRKPSFSARTLTGAAAYAKLLRRAGHTLENARAEAAEVFGMSAETVRDAMRDELFNKRADALIIAVMSYAKGDERKALERLRREASDSNSG